MNTTINLRRLAKIIGRLLSLASNRLLRFAEPEIKPEESPARDSPTTVTTRAIVITTFSERFFSDCIPLIKKLRSAQIELPIYVVVNADFGGHFNSQLRTDFLKALSNFRGCFPICSGRPLGMAALWNLGIRQSGADSNMILSDDLSVDENLVGECLNELFFRAERDCLVLLNDSFGHFAVNARCIETVGWFDERFLGFGQEDGDYVWRYEEHFGRPVPRIQRSGLSNRGSSSGYDVIEAAASTRSSLFNSEFLFAKYEFGAHGSHAGSFSQSAIRRIPETDPYPIERWRQRFLGLLFEKDAHRVKTEISRGLSHEPK